MVPGRATPRSRPRAGRRLWRSSKVAIFVGAVFSLLCRNVSAQNIDLTGVLQWIQARYTEEGRGSGPLFGRNEALLELALDQRWSDTWSLHGTVQTRRDWQNRQRNRALVKDAYVDVHVGKADVRVGRQIIAWGRTDRVNPTDNLSRRDYTDLLDIDDARFGVLAARTELHTTRGKWDLVVVPDSFESRLPERDSRWFFDLPREIVTGEGAVAVEYRFLPARRPPKASVQYAARFSGTARGWDYAASYFDGWNDFPLFRTEITPLRPDRIRIDVQEEHQRLRVAGADFATSVGKTSVRGEAAYVRRTGRDNGQSASYYHYVLDLDRTFRIRDRELLLLIEWSHQFAYRGLVYDNTDLDQVFDRALLGKVAYDVGDATTIEIEGVRNLRRADYYVRPRLAHRVGDRVTIEVGADLPGGARDSFFGGYRDNRRATVGVRYSFEIRPGSTVAKH